MSPQHLENSELHRQPRGLPVLDHVQQDLRYLALLAPRSQLHGGLSSHPGSRHRSQHRSLQRSQ
jgi:hypothetical protein